MAVIKDLVDQAFAAITIGRIALFMIAAWVLFYSIDIITNPTSRYPKDLPRVGHTGYLSILWNSTNYFGKYTAWMQEGYDKYGKRGRPFVIPGPPNRPANIMLPSSWTQWMLSQPDNILSMGAAHELSLYTSLNFFDPHMSENSFHARAIHSYLARSIPALLPGMQEGIEQTGPELFSAPPGQYKTVNIWDIWDELVLVVTNRMVLGPEVNDKETMHSFSRFAHNVIMNTFLLNASPKVFHSLLGRLLVMPNWWLYKKAEKVTIPIIKERVEKMLAKARGEPELKDWNEPEDYLTWHIRLALSTDNLSELNPTTISLRLLPTEFAALHTTVLTGHQFMVDILNAPKRNEMWAELKEEATRVFIQCGGKWTKAALGQLHKLDSAIRESQRLSNIAPTMVERLVMPAEGVTAPDGTHIPQGAMLGLNMQGVQHDSDVYANPYEFDPFRFLGDTQEAGNKSDSEEERRRQIKMTQTGEMHLAFGHGRHACPGRFFVAHELKMILAYMLMNCDIKMTGSIPKTGWVGQTVMPQMKATMQIRVNDKPVLV